MLSSNPGNWAMLTLTAATGTSPIVGYFMLENFTNQIQGIFRESMILMVVDTRAVLKKDSSVNLPKLICVI